MKHADRTVSNLWTTWKVLKLQSPMLFKCIMMPALNSKLLIVIIFNFSAFMYSFVVIFISLPILCGFVYLYRNNGRHNTDSSPTASQGSIHSGKRPD